jgi:HEAT repeat protein
MKHVFIAVLLFAGSVFSQEDRLLSILKSDAPLKEKADACQELARIGTGQAVPVLGALLTDEQLSPMAQFALEPIPDRSVDATFRAAAGKLEGRLLVGVIVSLGVRKDTQAVALLGKYLNDADPAMAQAAARSLGSIGGAAVSVLELALSDGSAANQPAVCEGLLRCAESLPTAEAAAIYDQVRRLPNAQHQVRVAALSGAIRSRGANGVPLLIEAIRTESYVRAADAIRISMDLPGAGVTRALAGELAQASPKTELLLLQALGHRGDATAVSALVPLARSGVSTRRVAAIRSLVQLGSSSSLPLLVALLKDPEATVSSAAQTGLVGFPGKEADAAVMLLLSERDARMRIMAIEAVAQRRTLTAVPDLLRFAGEADASVAGASFKALGELGEVAEIPGVVDALLQTKAVAAAETALTTICARQPDPTVCTDKLLPGLAKADGEPKLALLRAVGTLGGPQALAAVRAAATDLDASVRETACRVLCDWPTADALPDLAQITSEAADTRLKSLALHGQLRLIPMQTVTETQKVAQMKELLPLIKQLQEERLALATLGGLHCAESLALVTPYLTSDGLKGEASVAAVTIAEKIVARHPAEAAEAMQLVQTENNQLAGRVRQLLARIPECDRNAGSAPIFNGKDLTGWNGKPGWWTVEDGALTSESTTEKACSECNYLVWDGGQPTDFELLADFKLSPSANSGIQIRSEARPDWDTYGYQADMTGDGELVGFVYHHSRGLIAGRGEKAVLAADGQKTVERIGDPAELLKHFKQGDWNTYRVVCRGPELALYINGILMCQVTDLHVTQAPARGSIALQMHPGPPMKVQFKNLRLKELKPAPQPTKPNGEPASGS